VQRYGFNGKEGDDEIAHRLNCFDFGERSIDGRLGRWFSIDGLFGKFGFMSPYVFVNNNSILFIDKLGNDIYIGNGIDSKSDVKFEAGKPAPDFLNNFQRASWEALNKGISEQVGGEGSLLELATNTDLKLDIRMGPKNQSPIYENGELYWEPSTGMLAVDVDLDNKTMTVYPDDDKTKMSPERTFLHEVHHAVNDLVKKSLKKDSRSKPIEPLMDSREEETVITETDQQFLKRKNHYGLPMSENSCSSCTDGQLLPGLKTGSKVKPGFKVLTVIVKENEEMP
jgi:RHS repeat-associated protein